MSSYAAQKGRAVQPVKTQKTSDPGELSPAEEDRVAANKLFVQEHMADMIPLFKSLHAEGLITGWRCISSCRKISGD